MIFPSSPSHKSLKKAPNTTMMSESPKALLMSHTLRTESQVPAEAKSSEKMAVENRIGEIIKMISRKKNMK